MRICCGLAGRFYRLFWGFEGLKMEFGNWKVFQKKLRIEALLLC